MSEPSSCCAEKSRPAAGAGAGDSRRLVSTVFGPQASPDGFSALAQEWDALLKRARSNTVFLSHAWQSTWWRYLGEGELWIVALRRAADNRLVGIVPLYLLHHASGEWAGQRRLNLVGCIEVADYLDMIVMAGWESEVCQALLDWLEGDDAPAWDVLDFCNLPETSHTPQVVPQVFAGAGHRVAVVQEDVAPQFSLPARYDDYLTNQVDKKQRHEIRRKQRRAEREATIGFTIVDAGDCLEAEVDDFVALQRASHSDKADFMTPEMHRFFTGLARAMLDAGYLRLCFLTIDGEKAATLYAFEYNDHFLLYNSGYDPEAHAHLSPGWVLLAYAIQYAIAVGCTKFDFMQGDEEYKYRFGSEDLRVMRALVYHRRLEQ